MSAVHADAVALLAGWQGPSPAQTALAQAYLAFLAARPDACERTCAPGHLTASAMVFSADLSAVALVLHGIVGAWLAPGGHLEASDSTLAGAARREVREELGLEVELDPLPVTLDCHPITCRGYRTPTRHLDVRFVGRAAPQATLTLSDESREVAWWPVDALPEVFDEVRELVMLGRTRLLGAPPRVKRPLRGCSNARGVVGVPAEWWVRPRSGTDTRRAASVSAVAHLRRP